MAVKLTKAQDGWLRKIEREGDKLYPKPNYDMAGRMQDAGLIEIIDPAEGLAWPWGTRWTLRVTAAGRAALEPQTPPNQGEGQ